MKWDEENSFTIFLCLFKNQGGKRRQIGKTDFLKKNWKLNKQELWDILGHCALLKAYSKVYFWTSLQFSTLYNGMLFISLEGKLDLSCHLLLSWVLIDNKLSCLCNVHLPLLEIVWPLLWPEKTALILTKMQI